MALAGVARATGHLTGVSADSDDRLSRDIQQTKNCDWEVQMGMSEAVDVFLGSRPRLLGIAYRIVRNSSDAEDVVQDAWVRWQSADRSSVANPEAFLVKTTTRLALNEAQIARRRWEAPAGPWLPDLSDPTPGPGSDDERTEELERAVALMLTKLTPTERAAFLLREAFDYPYERIAELLHLNTQNCRQVMRRARIAMASERSRPVSADCCKRLLLALRSAARGGPIRDLEDLLVSDAARPVRSASNDVARRRLGGHTDHVATG